MKRLLGTMLLLFSAYLTVAQIKVAKENISWAPPDYNKTLKGTNYVPFNVTTTDGKTVSNETSKGKVTLIIFWFESCAGCRQEFAEVNELYDSLKHDKNFQLVAITFDDAGTLPPYIKQQGLHYPIATTGNKDTFSQLNYNMGCPSLALLDKEGKIVHIGIKSITKNKAASENEMALNNIITMVRKLE